MAAGTSELCRVTVVGPDRRVDLAVPTMMPLAELIPHFVRFLVTEDSAGTEEQFGGWLVQRLGDAPFGPAATPQSADWLDGEVLHLRRIEQPLPELDFDDVADAIATAVDRQPDRWTPAAQRRLFVGLAVFGAAATLVVLQQLPPVVAAAGTALVAVLLLLSAVRLARTGAERVALNWVVLAACAAGLLTGVAAFGVVPLEPPSIGPLTEAVLALTGAAIVATALLAIRATPFAPGLPLVSPLAVVLSEAGAVVFALLKRATGIGLEDAAAVLLVVLVIVALLAPRIAVRAAGIRVPQLPRAADEMRIDIDPLPAADVVVSAARADRYLSALIIAASALTVPLIWLVAHAGGWTALLLAAVLSALIAMRSREVFAVQQRIALVVAATAGLVAVLTVLVASGGIVSGLLIAAAVLGGAVVAMVTALRPHGRRMRPRWRQAVLVLEGLLAASCVPVLLGVLGVYAWARGLAG